MAERVQPQTGWVQPAEVAYCDVCGRRCWTWDLHHLIPVAWGGPDSRKDTDHQVVWVRADGDCHATIHMILDKAKTAGGWPKDWITQMDLPHLAVMAALRGWNGYKQQLFGPPAEPGGTIP